MKQVSLIADHRVEYGKSAMRRLRRSGLIPAIIYGHKKEPIALSLDGFYLRKVMDAVEGDNVLIELTIRTGKKTQKRLVVLKELQTHPLKKDYLHMDFCEIDMAEEIVVPVSIHLIGKAKGVEAGGVLQQIKREVELRCLVSKMPGHIEVDVSNLEIGKSISLNDIKLEEGIDILEELTLTVATLLPPTVVKEKEEEMPVEEPKEEIQDKS